MKRDLLTPLDFSVEELEQLFDRADDIRLHPENTRMPARAEKWRPASTSRRREPVFPMRPPC